jgi:hypothetical protein
LLTVPQPYAWAAAVFVDELDAGGLKGTFDNVDCRSARFSITRFELPYRDHSNSRSLSELHLRPLKKRSRCAALCGRDHVR